MPTITLRLELHQPTLAKQAMYQRMSEINTEFANWLLLHPEINDATSRIFKEFSGKKFPSAVVNQTIREVKSQKKKQRTQRFRKMWCGLNNQNLTVGKVGEFYTVAFPTQERKIGVPVVTREFQQAWLDKIIQGTVKQGAAKLYKKKQKWYLAVSITWEIESQKREKVMGIDLGLKYIAVASIGTQSLFFKGSQVAYIRRRYVTKRQKEAREREKTICH